MTMNKEVATFGGGCFWCIEAVVQRLKGVELVVSGYSGGNAPGHPTYREVCSGRTGHAEVIQVHFDPEIISYHDLIMVFMTSHDPTTLNRQGADRGTQYRSVIYYHNEEQKAIIGEVFQKLVGVYPDPIVTEVSPLDVFYQAEEDHQNYYNEHKEVGYCRVVIAPKLAKLRQMYADHLKEQ
ncbi:peptide-methionine (S)-S-oxide reductase MsrA [Crocinitomicaceae bacterium]|nr:peptide-methionine (S)-S-oxide reductase MsrA [Crocinitomicaceae bacterium]